MTYCDGGTDFDDPEFTRRAGCELRHEQRRLRAERDGRDHVGRLTGTAGRSVTESHRV